MSAPAARGIPRPIHPETPAGKDVGKDVGYSLQQDRKPCTSAQPFPYLAHLPVCVAGQAIISQWPLPVWVKLPLFTLVLTAFLLLSYQFLVRYAWVATLLNGPRKRPAKAASIRPGPDASTG